MRTLLSIALVAMCLSGCADNPGDATGTTPKMRFDLDEPFAIKGPGTWPVVLVFTPDGSDHELRIVGVSHSNGSLETDFLLRVSTESC